VQLKFISVCGACRTWRDVAAVQLEMAGAAVAAAAPAARPGARGRLDSLVVSLDDDVDSGEQTDRDGLHGAAAAVLSQSFASGSLTELSSLYSMSEDVRIYCMPPPL